MDKEFVSKIPKGCLDAMLEEVSHWVLMLGEKLKIIKVPSGQKSFFDSKNSNSVDIVEGHEFQVGEEGGMLSLNATSELREMVDFAEREHPLSEDETYWLIQVRWTDSAGQVESHEHLWAASEEGSRLLEKSFIRSRI